MSAFLFRSQQTVNMAEDMEENYLANFLLE